MTVNNRLQQFLHESGMTQTDLSSQLGISRQNVNAWFTKGTSISDKMLIRIIQAIENIDARWLVTGIKQENGIAMKGMTFTTQENYEIMLSKLMGSSRELGSVETENKFLKQQIVELQEQISKLQQN